jgi:hypothetical protein
MYTILKSLTQTLSKKLVHLVRKPLTFDKKFEELKWLKSDMVKRFSLKAQKSHDINN